MAAKRIVVRANRGGYSSVEVDGQLIPGVHEVTVKQEVNSLPVVTFVLVAQSLDMQSAPLEQGVPDAAAH